MVKSKVLITDTKDPWWNLAVEEYLLYELGKGEYILYLWQNQNTVVIGKNQNAWRECKTDLLEKEGGKLARRLSGGGAVFHDLGNLNFTFLVNRENYDLAKQVKVIQRAVSKAGIECEMSGRNDIITKDGRKFSGNAFCFKKDNAYHHGTILVSVDMDKLTRYLQVSEEKLKSKAVTSVQSRVVNLTEFNPALTIEKMKEYMVEAFEEVYDTKAEILYSTEDMDREKLDELYRKYSSWEWRYGESPKFDIELSQRFPWGGVTVGLQFQKGIIKKANIYSDAMDEEFIGLLPAAFEGSVFKSEIMADRIREIGRQHGRQEIAEDIAKWVENKGF